MTIDLTGIDKVMIPGHNVYYEKRDRFWIEKTGDEGEGIVIDTTTFHEYLPLIIRKGSGTIREGATLKIMGF